MRIIFSLWFLAFALLLAQEKSPQVVPVDQEPMHKLVFENEYVRVFSVEVPPGGETKYHRHERDYVSVILGAAEVESARLGEAGKAFTFKDGEALFTKGGFAHKAMNKGDKPFRNVTVELKRKIVDADVICGIGKGMCGASAGGADHPVRAWSAKYLIRAKGFSLEEKHVQGDRATLDFCANDTHTLAVFASAGALGSTTDIHGEPFTPGKLLWIPSLLLDSCSWYAIDAKYVLLEFDQIKGTPRRSRQD